MSTQKRANGLVGSPGLKSTSEYIAQYLDANNFDFKAAYDKAKGDRTTDPNGELNLELRDAEHFLLSAWQTREWNDLRGFGACGI